LKAISIDSHGPPEVIKIKDIPEPSCTKSKVKVKIIASSINHLDIWVRQGIKGLHIDFPHILGSDASGIICEVGSNVTDFKIGDNVVIQPGVYDANCKISQKGNENLSPSYGILGETQSGVQAEYVVLKPTNIHIMPKHLTYIQAAAMPLTFMTSYQMLIKRANISSNDVVFIYGATSGVGYAAIQIAKDMGCEVISTVGSADKIKYAKAAGADCTLLHDKNLYQNAKGYLKGRKVDVVFEHIGYKTWNTSMKLLATGGRLVTCGATTGIDVSLNLAHLFFKQLSILGSTMSDINSFNEVMLKISQNSYSPLIDKSFSYLDIIEAHKRIEDRKNIGKVVIQFEDRLCCM